MCNIKETRVLYVSIKSELYLQTRSLSVITRLYNLNSPECEHLGGFTETMNNGDKCNVKRDIHSTLMDEINISQW